MPSSEEEGFDPSNQILDIDTPLGGFSSGSQMETLGEAQNVTRTSSRALETFLVHLQIFDTTSFSAFVVATFRREQKHLQLFVALVELIRELLVGLHATIADKTMMEERRMKVEQEVIDICRWHQQLKDTQQ